MTKDSDEDHYTGDTYVFPQCLQPSHIDDYYVGHTLVNPQNGKFHIIKAYDGKTKTATIHGNWSEDPND